MTDGELLRSVREILVRDWDPIGINDQDACRDEYDGYAPALRRLLREGADEQKLAAHLRHITTVNMGLSRVDEQREQEVARQLLNVMTWSRPRSVQQHACGGSESIG